MRLPTATTRQAVFEDSRALHERLYAAFLAGNVDKVNVGTPDRAVKLSGNLHRFWSVRRFRFRISGSLIYIEPTSTGAQYEPADQVRESSDHV